MNLLLFVLHLLLFTLTSAQIVWINSPQSKAVVNNTDVIIDCLAEEEGGRTLSYLWKFNGTEIQSKTSKFLNNSLLIPKFSTLDVGHYECVVSDDSSPNSTESKKALVIIAYINGFLVHPESRSAALNTTVTFECITGRSAPKPEIFWNLNGQRLVDGVQLQTGYGDSDHTGLSGQVSMKLVITMEKKFRGLLRCIAVNAVLEKHTRSVEAAVYLSRSTGPPVIEVSPKREITAPLNSSLVLNCLIEGYKVITTWYKNDILYNASTTSFVYTNGSLIFLRVSQEDSGIYYCKGSNDEGNVTSSIANVTITVIDVEFQVEPSSAMVFAGQPLTLNCIPPISVPPASITWYKDNSPLTLDSTMSLVAPNLGVWDLHFSSVQAIHKGSYYCVAKNPLAVPSSRTSRVAVLQVQGAPIFIEPPLSQRVIKGRLLQLTCRVQGSPAPRVSWQYDGSDLQSSNQISFRDRSQELWITNVDKSYEGTYTCVAENVFGRKTVAAVVKIIVPPVTLKDFDEVIAATGDTAVLPCHVYGDPVPDITWFRDSQVVELDTRRYAEGISLNIANVTAADGGVYSCIAKNEAGNTSSNGTLSVLVPPKITEGPVPTVLVYGGSVLFPCKTEGIPKPSVEWFYNSTRNLPEGVSFLRDRVTLRISPVDWQHVGVYTCVVSNSVGLDRQTGDIRLKVIPVITEFLGQTVVDQEETIQVECAHKGIPAPSVEWVHQGEIINETLDGRVTFPKRGTLRIKFATRSDAGLYTCKIKNDVGSDSKDVMIYVIEPPKPPILTDVIPISRSSIDLAWIPNSQEPMTNVTGYAVSYKKRSEVEFTTFPGRLPPSLVHYEVEGLFPGTEYSFTVSADNSAGLGLPSNALSVYTLEAGPSEPVKLRVISVSPRSVRLSWEIPRQPNGKIRKYQVHYRETDNSNTITEYEVKDILNPVLPYQVYDLDDLHPYTEYEVRVRAANVQQESNLWGDYSVILTVSTPQAAPSSAPRNVTASSVSPHIINVQWEPPVIWEQNGPMTGYTVRYRDVLYQEENQDVHTLGSVTRVSLTELSPFRNYSLMVEAENVAGSGPSSASVVVQTLPTVLTVVPVNIQFVVESSSSVSVTWQVPPVREWTDRIVGSMIQYKEGDQGWTNITVSGTMNNTVLIRDLSPWTEYKVRAAFISESQSSETGPFSRVQTVKTLPDVPGPVTGLNCTSTNTSILVTWHPPSVHSGPVKHYTVSYTLIGRTAARESGNVVQVLPGLPSEQTGPSISVLTYTENATLDGLESSTLYNISVSMATEAGEGPPVSVLYSTISYTDPVTTQESLSQPITDITTDASFNTTSNLLTDTGGGSNRNLAVIVAGALTGGIFVMVIIAIIIWRCLKKRKAGREHYMKSVVSGVRITKRDSVSYDRQILDPTNIGEVDSNPPTRNDETQERRYSDYSSHEPVPQSPNSVNSSVMETSPSPKPVKRSGSFFRSLRNSFSGGDSVFAISSSPGIENPSYFEENMSATLPRSKIPSMTAEEVYSQAEKTQRKNRMRSESAAAIAVMRSSGNLAIQTNDTDTLINNEAFVVYNERTAL